MQYTQATIFGGTGFIGRYVIDRLADMGVQIKVPTRSVSGAYFLRTSGTVGQVVPVACNIHDDASVENAIKGSQWVVNLIGTLTEKGKKNSFDAVHHELPDRIARIAAQNGVEKLIHVSALGADKEGTSDYAKTKAFGEEAIKQHFPKATILRPSIIFGEEDKFFNLFAQMSTVLPFLPLIGGGSTKFQPVYVGDVATAVVKSLTDDTTQGRTFDVAGRETFTFKELLEKMMAVTTVKRPLVIIPFGLAKVQGAVMQRLPGQFLTVDQVNSLKTDNVSTGKNAGLHDLGIAPMALDDILPTYLSRFQPGGKFAPKKASR